MKDAYLDPATHDFPDPRLFRVMSDPDDRGEIVAQQCKVMMRTNEGEWAFDTSFGFPYLSYVFVHGAKPAIVASMARAKLSAMEGVLAVPECDFAADWQARKITGSAYITHRAGTELVSL